MHVPKFPCILISDGGNTLLVFYFYRVVHKCLYFKYIQSQLQPVYTLRNSNSICNMSIVLQHNSEFVRGTTVRNMLGILVCFYWHIKSLRSSNALWRERSRSTSVQVMISCLTALTHYLILTYRPWCPMVFTWEQYVTKCSKYTKLWFIYLWYRLYISGTNDLIPHDPFC